MSGVPYLSGINAPVKVNPDPPPPLTLGYSLRLILIACKKRQIPHHVGQEIAENAPPLGQPKTEGQNLLANNSTSRARRLLQGQYSIQENIGSKI